MANSFEDSKTYPLNADDLFRCGLSALVSSGMRLETQDPIAKRAKASNPMTLTDVRVRCEIEVVPISSTQSKINILAYPLASLGNRAAFGGGKNAKEKGARFLSHMESATTQLAAAQKTSSDDPAQKLKYLKEMLDLGLITIQDHDNKRSEILSRA
jgi:hypothetical protein